MGEAVTAAAKPHPRARKASESTRRLPLIGRGAPRRWDSVVYMRASSNGNESDVHGLRCGLVLRVYADRRQYTRRYGRDRSAQAHVPAAEPRLERNPSSAVTAGIDK